MGWTIGIYGRMGVRIPLQTEELGRLFAVRSLAHSQEGEYGIKTITREMAKSKMKPPACEAVWEVKLGQRIRFDKVWKIKADYVSPRDQIAWLKIQHRNLWVAASGGMHGSTKCSAAGCNEEEKQELHQSGARP